MKFLIVFGTVEGQTQKISETMAEHLNGLGNKTELFDACSRRQKELNVEGSDAIIVAAPVHQAAHQEAVVEFILANKKVLSEKPSALVSVSLAAALEPTGAEAQGYVDKLCEETSWTPSATLLAAGALRYDEYDFFKQQIVKFIVAQKGAGAEATEDHEYTDWGAIRAFADEFAGVVKAGVAA